MIQYYSEGCLAHVCMYVGFAGRITLIISADDDGDDDEGTLTDGVVVACRLTASKINEATRLSAQNC